jgi:nicotinamide mononucleotide adenylyltransferase
MHRFRPAQCNIEDAIRPLEKYKHNIWVVPTILNEVSVRDSIARSKSFSFLTLMDQSTRVRAQIQNGERVEDIPDSVYKYIRLHRLYQKEPTTNGRPAELTNGN